jgi:hypothetical protein
VLSAAGRGVVQVAAHERCVLVQCTIHKNLRFKNSIARSLVSAADHGITVMFTSQLMKLHRPQVPLETHCAKRFEINI